MFASIGQNVDDFLRSWRDSQIKIDTNIRKNDLLIKMYSRVSPEDYIIASLNLENLKSINKSFNYRINNRLVRGLDYYNRTVFEYITDSQGPQGVLLGGGRYDPLIKILGGQDTPAVGFAMGIERLVNELKKNLTIENNFIDAVLIIND